MGSVYIAICEYGGQPSNKGKPLVKGKPLTKGTILVKFGNSDYDDPTKRINSVTKKFNGMEHQCCAYYVSKYYKCIEEYLHARFENERVSTLLSRLDNDQRLSYCSQEHYEISEWRASSALKKAIKKIEGFSIEWIQEDV